MKTVTKIGIGLIVPYSVVNTVLKACDRIESAFQTVVKEKQEEAVEKTVDDFVKAVVTCRQVTIESKHNGCATVRLVVDR